MQRISELLALPAWLASLTGTRLESSRRAVLPAARPSGIRGHRGEGRLRGLGSGAAGGSSFASEPCCVTAGAQCAPLSVAFISRAASTNSNNSTRGGGARFHGSRRSNEPAPQFGHREPPACPRRRLLRSRGALRRKQARVYAPISATASAAPGLAGELQRWKRQLPCGGVS